MEPPPPFLHHPPRYVPLSRRPPHPPLNFSDDPNFYLPPPPPLPPPLPPPPQSYRPFPPPPPPPYNPHRLQFNFIDDDPHRYSPPPRVRVSQENHLEPFRIRDSDRHDLESSFRFRDDYSDRFKHSYTDDIAHRLDLDTSFHHNLDYYGRNSSSPSGGFPLNDSPVGSNLRTHDSFPVFHDNIDGNYMWRHPQLLFHGNLLEKGNNEFIDGNVLELRASGRGRDIYESGGFNGRDDNNSSNRGGKKEPFRNSRKKIQKKSALRRIQFPFSKFNGRNRDEGNSFNSANHFDDDLGPRSFRSRGNIMEGDRKGSLVDLDVSFKSNSLVAKAVVGSSGHEIDQNSKPISEKRKIASLICSPSINSSVGHVNSDSFTQEKGKTANVLGSASTNSSVGHLNLNISTEASGCPASSYKDSKKSVDFVVDSVGDHRPQSSFTDPRSPENKTVADPASDNGVNNAVPIGTNSSRIKKKKKKKKVLAPTRPEMKGKFEPTKEDGSIKSLVSIPPLDEGDINSEGKIIVTPVVSVDNFDLQPSQSRNSGFLGDNEVVKCRSATVSAKDCVGVDFGASLLRNAKRKRNSSSCLSSPQGLMRTGIDESTVIGDGPNGSHAISSCGKSSVRVQVTIAPDTGHIGDISHESCRTESQLLVQKSLVIASPVARLSVGDNVDNFSNPEKTGVQEGLTNVYDLPCGGPNNSDSDKGHVKLTIYDENANNSVTKIDKGFVHADNFAVEESRGYTTLVEGTVVTGLSNAKETTVHGVASEANDSEFDKDLMDSDRRMPFPGITSPGNSSCPDGTSELLENLPIEEPMKHTVTGRSNSHTGSEDQNIYNDREDGEIELCSPIRTDMPLEAVGKASATYKTLSCPAKDHTLTEVRIVGAVENFSLGSPPCTEKDSTFRSSSLSVDPFDCEFSSKGTVCSHDTSSRYMTMGEPSPVMSEEDTVSAGNCNSGAELPVNTGGEWAQIDNRDVGSNFETFSSVISSPYSVSSSLLFENNGTGAPLNAIGSREALIDCSLKFENGPCFLPRAEKHHKDFNAPPFTTGCHENSILCSEKGGDGIKVGAAAKTVAEEKLWADSFQHRSPVKSPAIDTFRMPRVSGMEGDLSMLETDSLTFFSTALPVCANGKDAPSTELCGKNVESESDKLSNMGCPYILPVLTKSQLLNEREGSPGLNSMKVGIGTRKNLLPAAVPRGFSVNSSLKKTAPTSHISKPRTWHRSSSPSFPSNPKNHCYPSSVSRRGKSPTVTGDVPPAAYVRKGNTLVRRTPLIAVTPKLSHASGSPVSWNPAGINEMKKTTGDESKVNFSSLETSVRTDLNAAMGRANTPPLPCSTKISDCTNHSSGPGTSEPLIDPPEIVISESESGPLKLEENMDLLKPSDGIPKFSVSHKYPTGQIGDSDSQYLNGGNLVSTNVSRVVYVKRKANQLIASPSSTDLSAQIADMTEALPSVGYYKRRKNQLIRKSMEIGKNVANKSLNSEVKSAPQITARSSVHRRIGRGLGKTGKPSRFSSVWMLQNASLKKENSLASQVWPYLFPWKRATYRKWFLYSRGAIAKNGSLTSIGRKLLHSRKRKTIYKRSTHGLSLRISKVLSVGGSSLKWSKSIERNSRKASKEATLAVAAVQMKKREKNGATDVTQTKHRNHSSRKLDTIELRPGERIFRVGSVRYKMDPTRWTLQRISDEGSLCSLAVQSGKDVKKSPVPRRLVIGNHEYVRIGNGNQLVRDPKKRTRIWAKERVRWSLHTARLRLARKNSYCQFFTRFGKCNKGDRKCPYIHDPEKIAVCTKFLKGSCSDSNCRLTHKVIPERMQDCSYFLQGLCSNETCPYRHVNVNPNASVCDGFLRGYCADGDECRKKHSYVCPVFESTGICPQGSKCKLHHPKNCSKGRRRQPSSEQKNARGRYFGSDSKHVSVLNSKITVSNKICAEGDGDGIFFREGKSTDFVPLDVSSDEEGRGGSVSNSNCELSCSGDGHPVDKDVEDLIKPIGIMRKIVMKESSPAVGSSMEKTSS